MPLVTNEEMERIVIKKLKATDLSLGRPDIIAKSLLSHYNYNLEKVLELAV